MKKAPTALTSTGKPFIVSSAVSRSGHEKNRVSHRACPGLGPGRFRSEKGRADPQSQRRSARGRAQGRPVGRPGDRAEHPGTLSHQRRSAFRGLSCRDDRRLQVPARGNIRPPDLSASDHEADGLLRQAVGHFRGFGAHHGGNGPGRRLQGLRTRRRGHGRLPGLRRPILPAADRRGLQGGLPGGGRRSRRRPSRGKEAG